MGDFSEYESETGRVLGGRGIPDPGGLDEQARTGAAEPIRTFTGTVIAVLHRLNDCEDKWIVSTDGSRPDRDEILRAIAFQEQYYMGELYVCPDQEGPTRQEEADR